MRNHFCIYKLIFKLIFRHRRGVLLQLLTCPGPGHVSRWFTRMSLDLWQQRRRRKLLTRACSSTGEPSCLEMFQIPRFLVLLPKSLVRCTNLMFILDVRFCPDLNFWALLSLQRNDLNTGRRSSRSNIRTWVAGDPARTFSKCSFCKILTDVNHHPQNTCRESTSAWRGI
jgi:hypothetical protein